MYTAPSRTVTPAAFAIRSPESRRRSRRFADSREGVAFRRLAVDALEVVDVNADVGELDGHPITTVAQTLVRARQAGLGDRDHVVLYELLGGE